MSSTPKHHPVVDHVLSFCRSLCTPGREACSAHREPREGEVSILAAVSGGRDSVALLHALAQASAQLGFRLAAVHINHRLRAAGRHRHEAQLVENACRALGVPFLYRELSDGAVRAEASRARCGPEAAARRLRYRELAAAAVESGAAFIATGHHAGDQLETCLQRFLRGSGPRGLAGIPARGALPLAEGVASGLEVIRPLLSVAPELLDEFIAALGMEVAEDESNRSLRYTRNRIRLELLPLLDDLQSGFRSAVRAAAARHAELADFVRNEAESRCPWIVSSSHGTALHSTGSHSTGSGAALSCDAAAFYALPPALRRESVLSAYERLAPGGEELPYRFLEPLVRAASAPDEGGTVLRGHGIRITLRRKRLFCARDVVLTAKKGYVFVVLKDMCVPIGAAGSLQITATAKGRRPDTSRGEVLIDRAAVHEPLLIRSRRQGDRILTRYGARKIKNICSEWGLDEEQKAVVPILEDRDGVLAVIGTPFGRSAVLAARAEIPNAPTSPSAEAFQITFDGV